MPAGLQIFDAAGVLTLDITDRLTKLFGTTDVSDNGSLTDARFADGVPFAALVPRDSYFQFNVSSSSNRIKVFPAVTFSGNTMTWTYPALGTGWEKAAVTIFYGLY